MKRLIKKMVKDEFGFESWFTYYAYWAPGCTIPPWELVRLNPGLLK